MFLSISVTFKVEGAPTITLIAFLKCYTIKISLKSKYPLLFYKILIAYHSKLTKLLHFITFPYAPSPKNIPSFN